MIWLRHVQIAVSKRWDSVRDAVLKTAAAPSPATDHNVAELAAKTAPVVWLIGKVQSGKSSIVRALTNVGAVEIGQGYKPCTKTAAVFDFPASAPVIRFLDTRGLGEAGYDPTADISFHETQAHVILVVMKALDPDQAIVVDVARRAREKHPNWPMVVAHTTLHEAYAPKESHCLPYPYSHDLAELAHNTCIPENLARSLSHQRASFDRFPGGGPIRFVALDFTQPGDGYEPPDYGLPALLSALEETAPYGLIAALKQSAGGALDAKTHPHIMGYAAAAAAADSVPVAGAVAVPVVQAKMLHGLAMIYKMQWNRETLAEFGACLGAGTLSRVFAGFGIRQLAKLIPVYGQTAGIAAAAAMSFATTFAIGKAACYFLERRKLGQADPQGVSRAYAEALADAFKIARKREQTV